MPPECRIARIISRVGLRLTFVRLRVFDDQTEADRFWQIRSCNVRRTRLRFVRTDRATAGSERRAGAKPGSGEKVRTSSEKKPGTAPTGMRRCPATGFANLEESSRHRIRYPQKALRTTETIELPNGPPREFEQPFGQAGITDGLFHYRRQTLAIVAEDLRIPLAGRGQDSCTTMVLTIVSCHPCFRESTATQRTPKPKHIKERPRVKYRPTY